MRNEGSTLKIRPPLPKHRQPRPAAYRCPACPTCATRGWNLTPGKYWCPRCNTGFAA